MVAIGGMLSLGMLGCGESKADPKAEAPPPVKVEAAGSEQLVKVDHADQFPLVPAGAHMSSAELNVTGVVSPDILMTQPAISIASGRVLEIKAKLGDTVKKGQVLMRVQSNDVASGFQTYRKAVNDELLARTQLDRAKVLYDKGAIAHKDLEVAEDAEKNAQVDLETAEQQLKLLGVDKDHPAGVVDVVAPISGVISDQQVTNAAGVQGLQSSASPFTVADLSKVWVMCDVYENDLPNVHEGEYADVKLSAYPDKKLRGRIDNVGPILDPNIRTAKVRLVIENPDRIMRIGMFVRATFHGSTLQQRATVPSTAILHLHDRDWVYEPAEQNQFKRVAVLGGKMLDGGLQEVISGLAPGDKVVSNALELQNTVEQ
jgi:cobalt-zinc-cadmium efflux system membrane fusion protein